MNSGQGMLVFLGLGKGSILGETATLVSSEMRALVVSERGVFGEGFCFE